MKCRGFFAALILLLAVGPGRAGVFDQFEDLGDLSDHMLSGGPGVDGIPAMTNPQIVNPNQVA